MKQLDAAAESVGGRIVDLVLLTKWFGIEVDSQTEENLRRICEKLMDTGLFSSVELSIVDVHGTLPGVDLPH